jgi:hypothetical protein
MRKQHGQSRDGASSEMMYCFANCALCRFFAERGHAMPGWICFRSGVEVSQAVLCRFFAERGHAMPGWICFRSGVEVSQAVLKWASYHRAYRMHRRTMRAMRSKRKIEGERVVC